MSCATRSFWIPLGQSHMTHIRIIGNSHVGSLKWATEPRCSPPSDLKVTFIAQRGARMGRLVVDGKEQPAETLCNGLHSRASLARRSRRLEVCGKSTDGLHSKDDRGPMNDKFGALYLRHVMHALSKATQ
jgi:hypothetical protein